MPALIPLRIRWISQAAINIAHDEGPRADQGAAARACWWGSSLDPSNLAAMGKGLNLARGDPSAMAEFNRHGLRVYGTFVFGYDHDTPESFDRVHDFAMRHGFFLCGFNHLTPMPGTPLYQRLKDQGRLLHDHWWLDDHYTYNTLPFRPPA